MRGDVFHNRCSNSHHHIIHRLTFVVFLYVQILVIKSVSVEQLLISSILKFAQQKIVRKSDTGCWLVAALSHVHCHTGLPTDAVTPSYKMQT